MNKENGQTTDVYENDDDIKGKIGRDHRNNRTEIKKKQKNTQFSCSQLMCALFMDKYRE